MTPLTKEFAIDSFKNYIEFDDQPSRDVDEIEILSISEPTPDPKDASRTCFDISANIFNFDDKNSSAKIVEAEVYQESYTLYFDQDGCCVQVDEH